MTDCQVVRNELSFGDIKRLLEDPTTPALMVFGLLDALAKTHDYSRPELREFEDQIAITSQLADETGERKILTDVARRARLWMARYAGRLYSRINQQRVEGWSANTHLDVVIRNMVCYYSTHENDCGSHDDREGVEKFLSLVLSRDLQMRMNKIPQTSMHSAIVQTDSIKILASYWLVSAIPTLYRRINELDASSVPELESSLWTDLPAKSCDGLYFMTLHEAKELRERFQSDTAFEKDVLLLLQAAGRDPNDKLSTVLMQLTASAINMRSNFLDRVPDKDRFDDEFIVDPD